MLRKPKVITREEALTVAITIGQALLKCAKCESTAIDVELIEYELVNDELAVHVRDTCTECSTAARYHVSPVNWACMQTALTWAKVSIAASLFKSEISSELEPPDRLGPLP